MGRIIVTGAHGFTGHYLVQRLLASDHEVYGFVRGQHQSSQRCAYPLYDIDLLDADGLADAVKEIRPQAVIHLAAIAFVAHGDVENMYHTNVIGTRNLLEALLNVAGSLQNLILTSSANVYGNQNSGALDECAPLRPTNDYAITKVTMEFIARIYSTRLPITIVRPFNYTGVGQDDRFIIPKIVGHFRRRERVIELGDISVERDFSDVRDVVDRYVRLLECSPDPGAVFNVCSGKSISLRDVISLASRLSGHDLEVRTNPTFLRHGEVRTLYGSDSRLKSQIGEVSRLPFEKTLRWMLEQ
jgi:nucleoside-diphosphate-sugar epimerase